MSPIPLPSKWIGWVLAGLCALAFGLALSCPKPTPDTPAKLAHATETRVKAVAVMDSVRTRVQNTHAISQIHLDRLKPLRARVTLTPNAVLVDGTDTLSGVGIGVVAQVIAGQDTTIAALTHESATKDTMIDAGDKALAASRKETAVAESLIPSKWQRVKTAVKCAIVGGVILEGVRLAVHVVAR